MQDSRMQGGMMDGGIMGGMMPAGRQLEMQPIRPRAALPTPPAPPPRQLLGATNWGDVAQGQVVSPGRAPPRGGQFHPLAQAVPSHLPSQPHSSSTQDPKARERGTPPPCAPSPQSWIPKGSPTAPRAGCPCACSTNPPISILSLFRGNGNWDQEATGRATTSLRTRVPRDGEGPGMGDAQG